MAMTNQEEREKVIKGLGDAVEYFDGKVQGVMFEAWMQESRKAIALLKAQEPCEDAVSRKDVINVLQSPCDMRYVNGNWHPCIGDYIEAIANLSAVAPKAQEPETSNESKPDDDVGCWYDITHKYTLEQVVSALKAHGPRVMTLEDLQRVQENEAPVWLESRGTWHGRKGFWIFVYEITPEKKVMRYNAAHMCECGWLGLGAYKKIWRCWTSRPTDAQREAIPWK